MLTATPVLNRPVELYAMLRHLCPDRLGHYLNYIAYTERYCEGKPGKWGYDATGADNLDELAKRLEGFMLRRTRDVLPDRQLQKIYMPFSKEIEKYLYTGNETESIRRKIGLGKIEPSAEHVINILENEQKIVLFAYHTDVIVGLNEKLKEYNPVVLQGETPTKKRQKVIDTFINDPKCRVFIGQIQAAGEGIDGLQRVASIAVFVEIAYTPGIIKQAIGRLYREGQKHKCLFQFLMVEGTIDEHILDTTIMKEKNIQVIMKDEKFGLDFSAQRKQKQGEKNMATEKNLLAAVEALENAMNLLKMCFADSQPCEETPEVGITKNEKDPEPKAERKNKVKENVLSDIELSDEAYQKTIQDIANRISQSSADPAKTNALFAKLNRTFSEKYPQYAHVFKAEKKDYRDILNMINTFLKAEKVK
jgi:SNF2 family DNA or RNA helicase